MPALIPVVAKGDFVSHPFPKKTQNASTEGSRSHEEDSQYKILKERASFLFNIYMKLEERKEVWPSI